jgi:hypothetical protein
MCAFISVASNIWLHRTTTLIKPIFWHTMLPDDDYKSASATGASETDDRSYGSSSASAGGRRLVLPATPGRPIELSVSSTSYAEGEGGDLESANPPVADTSPFDSTGFLQTITFDFVWKVVKAGSERELSTDDMETPPRDSLIQTMRKIPKGKTLLADLMNKFGARFAMVGFYKLMHALVLLAQAYLVYQLLCYFDGEETWLIDDEFTALFVALGFGLSVIVISFLNHLHFSRAQCLSSDVRAYVTFVIHDHLLKIRMCDLMGVDKGKVMSFLFWEFKS